MESVESLTIPTLAHFMNTRAIVLLKEFLYDRGRYEYSYQQLVSGNETSYRLKDVHFADQVKLMPVNERCISFVAFLDCDFFIFWWDAGKFWWASTEWSKGDVWWTQEGGFVQHHRRVFSVFRAGSFRHICIPYAVLFQFLCIYGWFQNVVFIRVLYLFSLVDDGFHEL